MTTLVEGLGFRVSILYCTVLYYLILDYTVLYCTIDINPDTTAQALYKQGTQTYEKEVLLRPGQDEGEVLGRAAGETNG